MWLNLMLQRNQQIVGYEIMRIWIDSEYNGFCGKLISMALVSEDGQEWYETLPCPKPKPWVKENVIPVLNREPLASHNEMSMSLFSFLKRFHNIHIISNWPEDIKHFCDLLIIGGE